MIERVDQRIARVVDDAIEWEMEQFCASLERAARAGLQKIKQSIEQSGKSMEEEFDQNAFVSASMARYY